MRIAVNEKTSLVFNQLTGAVAFVDTPWWKSLGLYGFEGRLEPNRLPESCEAFTGLKGALGEARYAELHDLGFLLARPGYEQYVKRIVDFGERFAQERQTTFFVTPVTQKHGCPLSCVYCFQKTAGDEAEPRLVKEGGVEAIERFILNYQTSRGLAPEKICIQVFGGEPLQAHLYDFWARILEVVRTRGWCWAIVTSGATLTPRYLDLIQGYQQDRLQELNITLDGPAETHDALRPLKSGQGTFEVIARNIDELTRRRIPVLVKTNFGRDNTGEYRQLLDMINDRGWLEGDIVVMTNVIQPFGEIEVKGQSVSEEAVMIPVIDLFRDPRYRHLWPVLRLEGKKLTGYLASAFNLPGDAREARRGKPIFDAYPYHAFCNPTKGTSWNIDPAGVLRTCNWMDGHTGFGETNIFERRQAIASNLGRFKSNAATHPICSGCDLNTICGGGCPIDMKVRTNYYESCRDKHGGIVKNFVDEVIRRGWVDPTLPAGSPFRVLRREFDFNYTYRNRAFPELRISDPGVAALNRR